MRIWIVTIGEPLPLPGTHPRLLRSGVFSKIMAKRGHDVTWWSSDFNHSGKTPWPSPKGPFELEPRLTLRLLHGMPYKRNVSLARLINHAQLAHAFRVESAKVAHPDLILCSFPTISLSRQATRFGREHGVPVFLDVRDLWPDIFLQVLPQVLRPLAQPVLAVLNRSAAQAIKEATGVIGISDSYLNWALAKAGRDRRSHDCVVPLGYNPPTDESLSLPPGSSVANLTRHQGILTAWFIGSFGQTYDLSTVIAAAQDITSSSTGSNIRFIFSGDGEQRTRWEREAAGLDNVIFTGWLSQPEIHHIAQVADFGLMAYGEGAPQGLPNKLFEYLAYGLPVLSSLEGETAEILREWNCGKSYMAGNPSGFKLQLSELTKEEQLYSCRKGAIDAFQSLASGQGYSDLAEHLEAHSI